MTRTRPNIDWVALDGLAAWYDCSPAPMRRKLPELYAHGFPQPCAVMKKWYLPRCRDWAADAPGETASAADDPLLEALDGHRAH